MSRKIRLIKGASYTGNGIRVTRGKPETEVSEAIAEKAVASGFFQYADEAAETQAEKEPTEEAEAEKEAEEISPEDLKLLEGVDVADLNLAQLKAVAKQMGISEKGLKTKASYVIAIEKAADAKKGSPTMIELQEE